jgi:hypothetical protein
VSSAIVAEYARLVVSLWSRGQHRVACPSWLSDSSVMVADRPLPRQLRTNIYFSGSKVEGGTRTRRSSMCLRFARHPPFTPRSPNDHISSFRIFAACLEWDSPLPLFACSLRSIHRHFESQRRRDDLTRTQSLSQLQLLELAFGRPRWIVLGWLPGWHLVGG